MQGEGRGGEGRGQALLALSQRECLKMRHTSRASLSHMVCPPTLATSCSTTLSIHSKRTSNVGCFSRSFSNSVQTRVGREGEGSGEGGGGEWGGRGRGVGREGRGEGYSGTVGYSALLVHVDLCVCVSGVTVMKTLMEVTVSRPPLPNYMASLTVANKVVHVAKRGPLLQNCVGLADNGSKLNGPPVVKETSDCITAAQHVAGRLQGGW